MTKTATTYTLINDRYGTAKVTFDSDRFNVTASSDEMKTIIEYALRTAYDSGVFDITTTSRKIKRLTHGDKEFPRVAIRMAAMELPEQTLIRNQQSESSGNSRQALRWNVARAAIVPSMAGYVAAALQAIDRFDDHTVKNILRVATDHNV